MRTMVTERPWGPTTQAVTCIARTVANGLAGTRASSASRPPRQPTHADRNCTGAEAVNRHLVARSTDTETRKEAPTLAISASATVNRTLGLPARPENVAVARCGRSISLISGRPVLGYDPALAPWPPARTSVEPITAAAARQRRIIRSAICRTPFSSSGPAALPAVHRGAIDSGGPPPATPAASRRWIRRAVATATRGCSRNDLGRAPSDLGSDIAVSDACSVGEWAGARLLPGYPFGKTKGQPGAHRASLSGNESLGPGALLEPGPSAGSARGAGRRQTAIAPGRPPRPAGSALGQGEPYRVTRPPLRSVERRRASRTTWRAVGIELSTVSRYGVTRQPLLRSASGVIETLHIRRSDTDSWCAPWDSNPEPAD